MLISFKMENEFFHFYFSKKKYDPISNESISILFHENDLLRLHVDIFN